jgi:hypothetical protein
MEMDIAGMEEINLDTPQFGVKQKCYDIIEKPFDHAKLVLSSSLITT